jgi:ABC-type amino acid transport substrate-binding protein
MMRRSISMLLSAGLAMLFAGCEVVASPGYAIVVSEATLADPAWAEVVGALEAKHASRGVMVVRHAGDVDDAVESLRVAMPAYTCFVAKPAEAGREFVAAVHRLTRLLDDDPYTDTLWGILTGFDAANAVAIAKTADPLVIERVTSGTELAMDRVVEGVWFSELEQNRMVVKPRGEAAKRARAEDDTTAAIAERLTSGQTDLVVTSGHATERDWQIGFGFRNGSFRSQGGRLFGAPTTGERFAIESSNPKVWLPIGNCLAGHIDGPDALALAFMNACGVRQMIGYTVPTWFGYAGWGCLDYFVEQPGRYTLAEAFHANGHALIHRLRGFEQMSESPGDVRGLRFDRDVVAFYGDPAWETRLADGPLNYDQTLTCKAEADSRVHGVLEVTPRRGVDSFLPVNTNGSQRGGRPILAFLPERLLDIELIEGDGHRPVITDRFVLVPNPGQSFDGKPIRVVFTGRAARAGKGSPEH